MRLNEHDTKESIRDRVRLSRRDWLRMTTAGLGSSLFVGGPLTVHVRAEPAQGGPRAKSSILLFMTGGSSDSQGAEPRNNPIHVSRFVATMLYAHGWDEGTPLYSADRRPHFFMPGKPIREIF